MQNVREEQLLVLLLVMAAQLHQLRDCRGGVLSQQLLDARVDMLTIGQDCPERRASQKPPARPGMARADRLIIRVEQEIKMIVKDAVPGQMRYEDETLKEPGRMGQMPFRGAGVRHRLHRGVGVRQRCDQRLARVSDSVVEPGQARGFAGPISRMRRVHRSHPIQAGSYYFDRPIESTTLVTPSVLAATLSAMDRSYPESTIPV